MAGGVYAYGHIYAGLKILYMDSLLVGFGPGTQVTGWDSVPAADRPPVAWLIHLCFGRPAGQQTNPIFERYTARSRQIAASRPAPSWPPARRSGRSSARAARPGVTSLDDGGDAWHQWRH